MKRVVLHIGARKAGSTSIQKYLVEHNAFLHEQGMHYIEAARGTRSQGDAYYAHHYAAKVHKQNTTHWKDIQQEIETLEALHTYILSSEVFYSVGLEGIQKIRTHLQGFDVDIIFVVRDRLAFLKSEYKQRIKNRREHKSFSSFAERNRYLSEFEKYTTQWQSVFGEDHVTVLDFDEYRRDKYKDLITDFCRAIGLRNSPGTAGKHNVSVAADRAVTLRFINRCSSLLGMKRKNRFVGQLKNSIKRKRTVGNVFHAMVNPFLSVTLIPIEEEQKVAALLAEEEGVFATDAESVK